MERIHCNIRTPVELATEHDRNCQNHNPNGTFTLYTVIVLSISLIVVCPVWETTTVMSCLPYSFSPSLEGSVWIKKQKAEKLKILKKKQTHRIELGWHPVNTELPMFIVNHLFIPPSKEREKAKKFLPRIQRTTSVITFSIPKTSSNYIPS